MIPTAILASLSIGWAAPTDGDEAQEAFRRLAEWKENPPATAQYDYEMSARVRLLIRWVGKDDVGGGFIRFASGGAAGRSRSIQVLFGSDPTKAPRQINRWGSAVEVLESKSGDDGLEESSLFFGLMKTSRGVSPSEMQHEFSAEANKGVHTFVTSLTLIKPQKGVSLKAPFVTHDDLDFGSVAQAEEIALNRLESPEAVPRSFNRATAEGCPRARGFLFTVKELADRSLSGTDEGQSLCFLHDGQSFLLTLKRARRVEQKTVRPGRSESVYRDLVEAHFVVHNEKTGKNSGFTMFVGTSGPLRGVPVEITYRPNWWFEVSLHLKPDSAALASPAESVLKEANKVIDK